MDGQGVHILRAPAAAATANLGPGHTLPLSQGPMSLQTAPGMAGMLPDVPVPVGLSLHICVPTPAHLLCSYVLHCPIRLHLHTTSSNIK